MTPVMHKTAAVLLLVVGVQLWLLIGHGQYGASPSLHVMAALVAVASLPPVFRRAARWMESVRHPSPRARRLTAVTVFAAATTFLAWTGFAQHRDLLPRVHDEHMTRLQSRMLARGRLWMPPHPAADSFESFYVFTRPVYAACYFPGAALLHVPSVWLHLPYWLVPAILAGGAAAMFYRVTAELLDGVSGLLAALLLLAMSEFRLLALMAMSHVPMLLIGLTLIWAWLRWRAAQRVGWAAVIGALGGLAAITRPADAVCWSIPIAVAMLWTMRKLPARRAAQAIALILLAAAPFLAIQGIFNLGVTGRLLHTPYQAYCDLYTPQSMFGFRKFDPSARPASSLPQLLAYYEQFIRPAAEQHTPAGIWDTWTRRRLPLLASTALPSQWLLVFLPVGFMAATTPARWVLLGVLPLWLVTYAMFPFLLAHYVVVATPMIIFAVLLSREALRDAFPRLRDWTTTLVTLLILVFALRAMPQFNRLVNDDVLDMPVMHFDHRLPAIVRQPAVVLYRFNAGGDPHDEPVYNAGVVWPDDAPIVRAHDRAPEQDRQLFRYYAQRQPDRQVYVVDRARVSEPGYEPQYLGRVADLAGQP